MFASVVLCVLSTLSFCICLRGLLTLLSAGHTPNYIRGQYSFSMQARRIKRNYFTVAMIILAIGALMGAVSSYIELFSYV